MSRTLLAVLLTCFCAVCFAPRSAHALNIPGVKDKKKEEEEKKRKEEERKKKEEEDKKAAEAKNDTAEPAPAAAPAKEDAPGPVAPAGDATMTEMTINAEAWAIYKNYKVGTFVEYSMPEQEGMKMRYEVVESGANYVVINTITSSPQFKQAAKVKYVFSEATEKVSAAGKEFDATKSEMKTNGAVVSRSWMSKDIPQLSGGLIKTEGPDGKTSMILSSYGEGK